LELKPSVLHRKETFLLPEHERYSKFARLTAQEEKHSLLAEPSSIGTRDGWTRRLGEGGFVLKGHRLFRLTGQRRGGEPTTLLFIAFIGDGAGGSIDHIVRPPPTAVVDLSW
jgi:hypothetical protein